jgi:hypothetical protein
VRIPNPEQDALTRLGGDSEGYGGQILDAEYFPNPRAIRLALSANIATSGAATTQQLTAGTGTFTAGRIQDDENPADAIDIAANGYTEIEWCVEATTESVDGVSYEFRVVADGVALDTYSQTPSLTIGAGAGAVDVAQSAEWSFESETFEDFAPDIAAIDSRPVVADAPAVAGLADQDAGFDWLAQYEEPDVPDYQWSGPVQPNAPNDLWDDPWSWQDAADEDAWQGADALHDIVATARQDFGDAFLDFGVELDPLVIPAGYQQQNGTPPPEPRPIDDPFDLAFVPEVEDDFFDDFGNIDADNACPDDAWNWDYDDHSPDELVLAVAVDSEPVVPNAAGAAPDQPSETGWDWDDAPTDDWPAIVCDSDDAVGPDVPPLDLAEADPDLWDWYEEAADPALLAIHDDEHPVGPDAVFEIAAPDAFDWTPDALEDAEFGTDPVGPNAGAPDVFIIEDAWSWGLDYEEALEADSAPVGADGPQDAPQALEWDWSEGPDELDFLEVLDPAPVAEEPSSLADDAWPWDEQAEDFTLEIVATAPGAVGPNAPPYIEDAWAHDDFCEDLTTELAAAGDVVGENFVPPLIDVRETFRAQADQTTFYPAIESDTFATPQDQDTFTPL